MSVTEEWIKKMWHISTMEYYSAVKKNESLSFIATYMRLEILILMGNVSSGPPVQLLLLGMSRT